MVLEWTPEEARIDLLCCCISQGNMGDSEWETQNHQTFCMRPVLVSFIYSCMFIIIDTPRDNLLHLKIASETQSIPIPSTFQNMNPWSEPWAAIQTILFMHFLESGTNPSLINLNLLRDSFASPNSGQSLTFQDQWRVCIPLGTRGPRNRSHDVSVYETCACVIHTNLLSYMCI